jgi:hypothetical protein
MLDVGTLLLGIAAIGTLLLNVRRGKRDRAVLHEINHAVNNKQPDEPTLREVAVQSALAIGRVEGKLDAHIHMPASLAHR